MAYTNMQGLEMAKVEGGKILPRTNPHLMTEGAIEALTSLQIPTFSNLRRDVVTMGSSEQDLRNLEGRVEKLETGLEKVLAFIEDMEKYQLPTDIQEKNKKKLRRSKRKVHRAGKLEY